MSMRILSRNEGQDDRLGFRKEGEEIFEDFRREIRFLLLSGGIQRYFREPANRNDRTLINITPAYL
jgi:hypothetical protein